MSEPIIANDLVLLTTFIRHDSYARLAAVTYAADDATLNASAQVWADVFQANFADDWKDNLDNQAVILRTDVIKGDGTSTFTVGSSTAAGTRGTASMSALPPNCAALVRKQTAVGGRKNRGRLYMPWILNEGSVDQMGNIDNSDVLSYQSDADDWLDHFDDAGAGGMVIANRVYDLPWDNPARKLVSIDMGPVVTALVVEPIIATQRRRLVRS